MLMGSRLSENLPFPFGNEMLAVPWRGCNVGGAWWKVAGWQTKAERLTAATRPSSAEPPVKADRGAD